MTFALASCGSSPNDFTPPVQGGAGTVVSLGKTDGGHDSQVDVPSTSGGGAGKSGSGGSGSGGSGSGGSAAGSSGAGGPAGAGGSAGGSGGSAAGGSGGGAPQECPSAGARPLAGHFWRGRCVQLTGAATSSAAGAAAA
jgi:hypothetical protein